MPNEQENAQLTADIVRTIHQNLPGGGPPNGVKNNANTAVLCGIVAFQQLDKADQSGNSQAMLEIAAERMLVGNKPILVLEEYEVVDDCWAVDTSNGTIMYQCDSENSDERLMPCMLCPALSGTAIKVAIRDLIEGLQPAMATSREQSTDRQQLENTINDCLDQLTAVVRRLTKAEDSPQKKAAALALGNAAYHLLGCAAYLQDRPQKGNLGTVQDREEEMANLVHHAVSGQASSVTVGRQANEGEHCDRVIVMPSRLTFYLCQDPEQTPSQRDEQPEKCANCIFHGKKHRPRLDELMSKIVQAEETEATNDVNRN